MSHKPNGISPGRRWPAMLLVVGVALVAVAGMGSASATPADQATTPAQAFHPTFRVLDADGKNVLESGLPMSTMQTCGACHDTDYIEQHSFHADLGLSDFSDASLELARPWDQSRGMFGKWDPLTYRYLSPTESDQIDLTTVDWLKLNGARIPGGGPATTARDGTPLTALPASATNPETSFVDPVTGELAVWDWKKSGSVEMDCVLCHTVMPDTDARTEAIQTGDFGWATTASLLTTGIVTKTDAGYTWVESAFDESGELKSGMLQIQDPSNENCSQCHGVVHTDAQTPLLLDACDQSMPQTATTGQVIASQKINESAINLQDKGGLARSWDIHAERGLKCTDCHYALNNPIHAQESANETLEHLTYDPRKLEIGEYLQYPNHNLARGQSAQFTLEPELKGSMRRCESCHNAAETHADWLPYAERHMDVMACESCHVAQMYAPALQSVDWTVLDQTGSAVTECRGITGTDTITGLVTGFQPVLMQRQNIDGESQLAPYNLISSWYWLADDASGAPSPIPLTVLKAVYLENGAYAPDVMAAFDADGDQVIDGTELKIDTPEKEALISGKLTALGYNSPRIDGQVQPYSINHGVGRGEWATRNCQECHNDDSAVTMPIELTASVPPGGVTPRFVSDNNVSASGEIQSNGGTLLYQPIAENEGIYVFGRNRVSWVDWLGALAFIGTLLAVGVHATMRFYAALRQPHHEPKLKRVYMYPAYERFWHWLQTATIILLLFTGLVIHRPDMFGIFSFPHMVTMHNILAVILVANAAMSLFWHLSGGQIRQYIPRPYGFFDQAIEQTKFYLWGIFKGAPHPHVKTRREHLNPLQQVTYFGILNVLLPLQIVTGALMWGAQEMPTMAETIGGLTVLAPIHSLAAWLFATFIVAHVYLTTTGHEPMAGIKAMVTGWDEVEVPSSSRPTAKSEPQGDASLRPAYPSTLTEASE